MSKYKVFTNLVYTDMIDDDVNDPKARAQALAMGAGSGGDIFESYKDNYVVGFRRAYRRRMSETLLRKYGFLPEVTRISKFDGVNYAISKNGVFVSMEKKHPEKVDNSPNPPSYPELFFDDYQDLNSVCNKQFGIAYKPVPNTLTNVTIGTKTGDFHDIQYVFDSVIYGNKILQATHSDGSLHKIENSGKVITGGNNAIDRPYPNDTSIYSMKYTRNQDGATVYEVGYMPALPSNAFEIIEMATTPVVMLKEDNVMNPGLDDGSEEYSQMKRMLRKLGLDGDDLVNELQYACNNEDDVVDAPSYDVDGNLVDCDTYRGQTYHADGSIQKECGECNKSQHKASTIDNAYIFTGIYPAGKTQGELEAMFYFFDYFAGSTTESFTAEMNNMYVKYDFIARKETKPGRWLDTKTGQYASTLTKEDEEWETGNNPFPTTGANNELRIYKQITDSEHEIIMVKNFVQKTIVRTEGKEYSHVGKLFYSDGEEDDDGNVIDGSEHTRIIIPLDIYNNTKYRRWIEMYEHGMSMMAYSYEKVKLKWYQRGIFKILVVVIMVVVTIYSAGTAAQAVAALAEMVFDMMIAFAVTTLANMITDNPFILAIIAIASMVITGQIDMNNLNFDGFLKIATKLIDSVNQATQEMQLKALAADQERLNELKEENKELEEKYKETFGTDGVNMIGSYGSGTSSGSSMLNHPQMFLDTATGDGQYDFDSLYDVTGEIERRLTTEAQ